MSFRSYVHLGAGDTYTKSRDCTLLHSVVHVQRPSVRPSVDPPTGLRYASPPPAFSPFPSHHRHPPSHHADPHTPPYTPIHHSFRRPQLRVGTKCVYIQSGPKRRKRSMQSGGGGGSAWQGHPQEGTRQQRTPPPPFPSRSPQHLLPTPSPPTSPPPPPLPLHPDLIPCRNADEWERRLHMKCS